MKTAPWLATALLVILMIITFYYLVKTFRKGLQQAMPIQRNLPLVIVLVLLSAGSIAAASGWLHTTDVFPPRLLFAVIPMLFCAIYFAFAYKPFTNHLHHISPAAIIYLQTFRFPLELLFLWFMSADVLPIQMTLEGRNPDMLIGITAPLIAYLGIQKGKLPRWVIIAWNFIGLGFLFNIVTIAILSVPGPMRYFMNEPANTLVMDFPFQLIPTFLVPLALFLHLFSLRQLLRKQST